LWPRQAASGHKSWRLQIMLERERRLPISSPMRLPSDKYMPAHDMLGLIETAFDNAFVQIRKTFSVL
jgi:hypothetical protein